MELTPNDFDKNTTFLLNDKNKVLVMFYVPYCKYCKERKPIFEQFIKQTDKGYLFNCDKYLDHRCKIDMDYGDKFIIQFPSIVLYNYGEPQIIYTESFTLFDLYNIYIR